MGVRTCLICTIGYCQFFTNSPLPSFPDFLRILLYNFIFSPLSNHFPRRSFPAFDQVFSPGRMRGRKVHLMIFFPQSRTLVTHEILRFRSALYQNMAYHTLAHGLEKHTSGPIDVSETSPASHAFPERFRGTLNPFHRSIKTVSENIECGDKGHTPFLLRVIHLICPCPPVTLASVPSPAVVGPQLYHITFPPVTENHQMSAHIIPPVKVSSSYVPPNDSSASSTSLQLSPKTNPA